MGKAGALSDRRLEAECLHGLANVRCYHGDFPLALEAMHQSVVIRREIGDEPGIMGDLNSLGAFYKALGSYSQAVDHLAEALAIARRLGDRATEAMALSNIGSLKMLCNEPAEALDYLQEGVRLGEALGDRVSLPLSLNLLASAYHALGRLPEALAAAERSAGWRARRATPIIA